MKKLITILFVAFTLAGALSACGNTSGPETNVSQEDTSDKISIITTIFPEYDWVREILGDRADDVELTLLLDNGVDLHNYQPTADDLVKISRCNLFIYVGGESDAWVEDVLKQASNKDMMVLNLLEVLGDSAKGEEMKEGMEGVEEPEHETEEEENEYDEHIWLSLKNAEVLCKAISECLSVIDPENEGIYSKNVTAYNEKLSALDSKYQETVDGAERNTLLFGDRFPFRYLVDDYGLDYFAAFAGCSAETEASFETIAFLANKMDEMNLAYILTIDETEHTLADTIIANTSEKNQAVLTMNSLQSTTSNDVENGTTYLSVMEQNLEVLKEALK